MSALGWRVIVDTYNIVLLILLGLVLLLLVYY